MSIPKFLKYTKEHDWVRYDEDENVVVVGVTDYAQEKIGDVTYVELPEEGDEVDPSSSFVEIEHHKGREEVYPPVSGRVVEVNEALEEAPELINQDPYDEGWLVKIEPSDLAELEELMDATEYEEYLGTLDEE